MWLDVICVNISICTFIPLCNFDMRPYLQFDKFGLIFKAAFESRPRHSPDMDEAPGKKRKKKHGVRVGAGGFVSDFSMEMFDEGFFGVRLRWFFHVFPQEVYCCKRAWMTVSSVQLEIWCPSIRFKKLLNNQRDGIPWKVHGFILWEGVQSNGLSWEACFEHVCYHSSTPPLQTNKHLLRSTFCFFLRTSPKTPQATL